MPLLPNDEYCHNNGAMFCSEGNEGGCSAVDGVDLRERRVGEAHPVHESHGEYQSFNTGNIHFIL